MGEVLAQQSPEAKPEPEAQRYFDIFLEQNIEAVAAKLDGPHGLFAEAEKAGVIEKLHPELEAKIDAINEVALSRLGITKYELKTLVAIFGGGQERSALQEIKIPNFIKVNGNVLETELGDTPIAIRPDTGEPAIPKGRFGRGDLWMFPQRLEEKYPDMKQRRVAAIWVAAHELTHSVIHEPLVKALRNQPGEVLRGRKGGRVNSTTYLRHMLEQHFPAEKALTDYAAAYRDPDGSFPDWGKDPVRAQKAVEEEMCETMAASVCGFTPTPGLDHDSALRRPFADRSEFQRQTVKFIQAHRA